MNRLLTLVSLALTLTAAALHGRCIAAVIHVPTDQPTIQAGIDAATTGDTVLVADGTYTGAGNKNLDFKGKAITVASENGASGCIIDCENDGRGFRFWQDEDEKSVLRGFTIQHGFLGGSTFEDWGVGIRCYYSSPVIRDCVIRQNSAVYPGGVGIMIDLCSPFIINCQIMNNYGGSGAGISCTDSNALILNCIIAGNVAVGAGGGGGIAISTSAPVIANCLIIDNTASEGSGIGCSSLEVIITNCTVTANNMNYNVYCEVVDPIITNCIIWSGNYDALYTMRPPPLTVTYSDISRWRHGEGNIDADPLFTTGPYGQYWYLSQVAAGQAATSPCVDAGDQAAATAWYVWPYGVESMSWLTTRSDEALDAGQVDMGFHWPTAAFPLPSVRLSLSQTVFKPGDELVLSASLTNPGPETLTQQPLAVALEAFGTFYWYPAWTDQFGSLPVDLETGAQNLEILRFIWPNEPSEANGIRFYSAMLTQDLTAILGRWDVTSFGWRP